jgi:hypothetical protein
MPAFWPLITVTYAKQHTTNDIAAHASNGAFLHHVLQTQSVCAPGKTSAFSVIAYRCSSMWLVMADLTGQHCLESVSWWRRVEEMKNKLSHGQ